MGPKTFLLIAALTVCSSQALRAQDASLTNYRSGIDVTFSGAAGTDYQEEYFFSDKLISDRKVVYIKSSTAITLAHNSRNVSYSGSGSYALNSSNGGTILYKIDRDLQWGRCWGDANGITDTFLNFAGGQFPVPRVDNPTYAGPFTLASQTYNGSTPVVGTTGPLPGPAITNVGSYYWRGILDSVGDEWHVLTVADYDSFVGDPEGKSSDGKVVLFVVNPKTPCLTITVSGNAQFYTTPPKIYFTPKIHDQTTYIAPGSGDVSFSLKSLGGENVFYQINGGAWSAGAVNPVLHASDFNDGANTLKYYYQGQIANTKTRIVQKNPGFPSAGEAHGNAMWKDAAGLNQVRARAGRAPYAAFLDGYRTNDFFNRQNLFDPVVRQGKRIGFIAVSMNAFTALMDGWTAVRPGKSKSYALYAKQMLMENYRNLDPVGFEINHSSRSVPTRELFFRGYYDVDAIFDMAFGYDLLIANFRSNQQANGITAIEDYFIRDQLAAYAFEAMMQEGNYTGQEYPNTGMWGTARNIGGLIVAMIMPSYSTPYYGTSGFDGNTTVYPYTPFPDTPLTWKKVFLNNDAPLTGYPNLHYRFGVEEYQIHADGNFDDRVSYYGYTLMGHCFYTLANMTKLYTAVSYPRMEASFQKAVGGTLIGLKDPSEGAGRFSAVTVLNPRYVNLAVGINVMKGASGVEGENGQLFYSTLLGPYGFAWYEDDTTSPVVAPPTNGKVSIQVN